MEREQKKNYLRNFFYRCIGDNQYDTFIFKATFPLDYIKDLIEEVLEEFKIKRIIYIDFNGEEIKKFLETKPTYREMKEYVPTYLEPIGKTKLVYLENSLTDFSNDYYEAYSSNFLDAINNKNRKVFDMIDSLPLDNKVLTSIPNPIWAEALFGSKDDIDKLWELLLKTQLSKKAEIEIIKQKIEQKNILNGLNISKLSFYTKQGTDFTIGLTPYSRWTCEPNSIENIYNPFNYPSYEIFTSPDCYSAQGDIVLTRKRRYYYETMVEKASFTFDKGKLKSVYSNSKDFNNMIFDRRNKLNRIGEIALVAQDSPLVKIKDYYDSVVLDENTGCHFALGRSLMQSIDLSKEKIEEHGLRYYRFNTSNFHIDLVFGDDSICVEAKTRSRKNIVIMENGKWKI